MIYIAKFLLGFVLTYFFFFFITFIVTRIASVTMSFKDKIKAQEKGIVKKPKKIKEVKKTWNESLGVWEID